MSIQEMIAIVQVYIHVRKGVEVQIVIRHQVDVLLLTQAYNIATVWMKENNCVVVLV